MGLDKLPQVRTTLALTILFLSALIGYNHPRAYVAAGIAIATVILGFVYVYFDRKYVSGSPFIVTLYNYISPLKILILDVMINGEFFTNDAYHVVAPFVTFVTRLVFAVFLFYPFAILLSRQPLSVFIYSAFSILALAFPLVLYDTIMQPIVVLTLSLVLYLDPVVRRYITPSNVIISFAAPIAYHVTCFGMYYATNQLQLILSIIPVIFVLLVTYLISFYEDL